LAEPADSGSQDLWRTRELALALVFGLLVTLLVVWRDADRADATYVIGAVPAQPLSAFELTGMPRRSFALPRLTHDGRGRVLLQIATYLQPPSATVRLDVVDARGRPQARCTFPPSSYHDNTLLRCDVPSVVRARRVVVSHAGPAKLAVLANDGVAGYLAYTSSGDLFSRMRSVVDRVGIELPAGLGPTVLLGGLWLSTAAAALGVLIALRVARERPDALLEQGEPLGEPAGVLAEPRDDEREVQHDGQEEAEGDDEEGVGGRGDPERARDALEQGGPGREDEHRQPGDEPEH
jgi:hypothetical protein